MTTSAAPAAGPVLEIFWMPGCSSCLRMKEFVERIGVPHQAVDVAAHPSQAARLVELGLAVPAAVLGDAGVPGVDLVGIARLVGYDYDPPPRLEPAALKVRYDAVADVASRVIDDVPAAGLDYKAADRDRTLRYLCLHLGTIMRGFVASEDTNVFTDGYEFIPETLVGTGTGPELAAVLAETRQQFDQWWRQVGYDDPFDRVLESDTGHWTLHEALERAVWHTAQHVRQLQYFLETDLGVVPSARLGEDLLEGLPVPEGIHA